jgi:predicted translin family RNA/ssDNA-binding protein
MNKKKQITNNKGANMKTTTTTSKKQSSESIKDLVNKRYMDLVDEMFVLDEVHRELRKDSENAIKAFVTERFEAIEKSLEEIKELLKKKD